MKTLIRQCKFCPKNDSCEFRDSMKEELRDLFVGTTALISCPVYRSLFKAGDRVSLIAHDMDDTEDVGIEGGYRVSCPPYYEETGIKVHGAITGQVRHGLFQIRLDKTIKLNRVVDGKLQEVELEFYTKPANQLTIQNPLREES